VALGRSACYIIAVFEQEVVMKPRHVSRFLLALAVALLALAAAAPVSYAEGPAAAPTAVIPPASPLGKIKEGMDSDEVTKILGAPSSTGRHVTGKAFIPFYFGTDALKTEWRYKNVGRVIVSKGSFSASHVSGIEYNPNESGADRGIG
jgi:hypothetical protein